MIKHINFGANCQFSTNELMKILISKYLLSCLIILMTKITLKHNTINSLRSQMIISFIHRCPRDLIGLNSITILVFMQGIPTAQFSSNPHRTNISRPQKSKLAQGIAERLTVATITVNTPQEGLHYNCRCITNVLLWFLFKSALAGATDPVCNALGQFVEFGVRTGWNL